MPKWEPDAPSGNTDSPTLVHHRLDRLIDHFGIRQWDILLAGDASGCGWDIGMGWAGVLVDHATNCRKFLTGAWNYGSIMIAEIMPYLHAMSWYEHNHGDSRRQAKGARGKTPILEVHVLCDNDTIVRQGNHECSRKKMMPWWLAWDGLMRYGYTATFHFTPRLTTGMNQLCDRVSGTCRTTLQHITPQTVFPGGNVSVYDFNPS